MVDRVSIEEAKEKLDTLISKQRVALYKPIRVAEILHRVRIGELDIDQLLNVENYRNVSKRWRDEISRELINQICTSSQRFQDNLFAENAMPPKYLYVLAKENDRCNGIVERYIYQQFNKRQKTIFNLAELIEKAKPDSFQIDEFFDNFISEKGIKRSIDKAYEVVVFALFNTLVEKLNITVTLEIDPSKIEMLDEFEQFAIKVLGISKENPKISLPAQLYRAGVANAADRGLDIWANFGPVIQVKHLTLTEKLAEGISEEVVSDRIIIVCKECEQDKISNICLQLGFSDRIQAIITREELSNWYKKALQGKYSDILGKSLLEHLRREFLNEFTVCKTFDNFYKGRNYHNVSTKGSIFYEVD